MCCITAQEQASPAPARPYTTLGKGEPAPLSPVASPCRQGAFRPVDP
jgi:hypothetical protein